MSDAELEIGVLLFASVREALGRERLTVRLSPGSTTADLLDRLAEEHPALAGLKSSLSVAVNQEFARRDAVLAAGDEVALIPPVGGG